MFEKLKTVFLDRDGVINKEIGYLHKTSDFQFIDYVFQSCKYLNSIGYQIIVITNQSGIGRGFYSKKDFFELNEWMIKQFRNSGVEIQEVFFCPHSPEDDCECRKPKPGMFHSAFKKFNIDKKNSWMIGDKEDDITAARNAGLENTILVRSGHDINEKISKAKFIVDSIKDITSLIN